MHKRFLKLSVVSALGFIAGVIVCAAMTPILWKLESTLQIELAGHSGPTDWLFLSFGVLFAALSVALSWKRVR